MSVKNFRTDINGLRAYAVILVVLFHFQVFGFSAGYLGVDIFFVISGYLMTKIIIEKLEKRLFSFTDFYLARIIRIFPALLFVILFLTVLGWFIFIPEDFKVFAKDARYSLTFLSNELYYRQAGDYFAPDTHDKVLLHTWSLAVEWQFYILFPILLVFYAKLDKKLKHIGILLSLLFFSSLYLSINITPNDPMYAFYKLTTRAWELIAGGLVYCYSRNLQLSVPLQKINEGVGFVCIIVSLVVLNQNTPWPGYAALLPVIGTMLILVANRQDSILTRTKLIQNIGSASYSIYLWHWPVFFLLNYFIITHNLINISLAIILSFILGWLSYTYIENSRNFLQKLNRKYAYLLFFIILVISYPIYKYIGEDGVKSRANPTYLSNLEKMQMPSVENGWCFYNIKDNRSLNVGQQGLECFLASKQDHAQSALLFGDSFAGHNNPFWDHIGKKLNLNIQVISTNWCYPSFDKQFTGNTSSISYQQCLFNRQYLAQNIDKYDVLIFAGRWSEVVRMEQQNTFAEVLAIAEQHHKKVIVMEEPHVFDKNISLMFRRAMWLQKELSLESYLENEKATQQKYAAKVIDNMVAKHSNTLLLKQQELFRPDQMATPLLPYSFDGRHISIAGSLASAQYFEQQAKYKLLQQFILE